LADRYAARLDGGDKRRSTHLDTKVPQLIFGAAGEIFGVGGEHTWPAFEQNDFCPLRIDGMKFVGQRLPRDLCQRARQLHPGWTAAHNHKIQLHVVLATGCLTFCQFEGQQHAPADFQGIFDGLEAWSQWFPLIVAEIGMARPGGDHQVGIGNFHIAQFHNSAREIEILDFRHQHFYVATTAHNPANRGGDFARRQSRRSYLIEKRLEGMEVLAVNERDLNRVARKCSRGHQPAEASTDDYYPRRALAVHSPQFIRFRQMSSASKSFPQQQCREEKWQHSANLRLLLEICTSYFLLELALWTPQGPLAILWMMVTTATIVIFAFRGSYSIEAMGLGIPDIRATALVLALGLALGVGITIAGALTSTFGPVHQLSFSASWQYAIWAFVQEFILQSFFFLRLETLLGGRWAVVAAAVLFSAAHLPNLLLVVLTLPMALLFCQLFSFYRSIWPLGLVHAALGLTMAASFSDATLHHMRVGIGYLLLH
jgi:membrane protease YdiL (CAAX protease family)